MSIADILSALFAYGLLHMRGIQGAAGWRWLFLIEGILTFVVGVLSFLLMPAGPCQTASWFRGKKGWFSEREEKIIVNRVLREDPSKSGMHNREPVTPRLLWQSLKDFDLWYVQSAANLGFQKTNQSQAALHSGSHLPNSNDAGDELHYLDAEGSRVRHLPVQSVDHPIHSASQ